MTGHRSPTRSFEVDLGHGSLTVHPNRWRRRVEGPGQALTWHLDEYQHILSDNGYDLLAHLVQSAERIGLDNIAIAGSLHRAVSARQAMIAAVLDSAPTYYVSADMSRLVNGLAHAFTDDDLPNLTFEDVPSPSGVFVYEDAWYDRSMGEHLDASQVGDFDFEEALRTRAIAWQVIAPGRPIFDLGRHGPKGMRPEVLLTGGNGQTSAMDELLERGGILLLGFYDGSHYLVNESYFRNVGRPPGMPILPIALPFGGHANIGEEYGQYRSHRAHIVALMRLMWQRVIPQDPAPIDRAGRRRWGRIMEADAKVVHLRRYVPRHRATNPDRDEDTEPRRLAYTVTVRGHWRDQWYATLGPAFHEDGTWNPASHRRIWIDAHLRGDGPLAEGRHQVTAVVR